MTHIRNVNITAKISDMKKMGKNTVIIDALKTIHTWDANQNLKNDQLQSQWIGKEILC